MTGMLRLDLIPQVLNEITCTDQLLWMMGLFVLFQLKHFLADYPLQFEWMLGKFKDGWGFIPPLLAHSAVHGFFTLAICLWFEPSLWWLALVDMGAHFVMDRIKAGSRWLGRFKPVSSREFQEISRVKKATGKLPQPLRKKAQDNKMFWWSLGLDQMVHHLTHYFIIFMLVTA